MTNRRGFPGTVGAAGVPASPPDGSAVLPIEGSREKLRKASPSREALDLLPHVGATRREEFERAGEVRAYGTRYRLEYNHRQPDGALGCQTPARKTIQLLGSSWREVIGVCFLYSVS